MNEPQSGISPEQKLLIQKYLGSLIKEWLAWIGAANLLFIVGALSYVLFVLPGKAANEANKAMENNIKFYVDTIQGKLPEVFHQSGKHRVRSRIENLLIFLCNSFFEKSF